MYFHGPCLNCDENYPHFTDCPSTNGNGGAVSISALCTEIINTNCLTYTGKAFPCVSITSSENLNTFIDILSTPYANCNTCDNPYTFTRNCKEGWKLIFRNTNYTATWYFKNPTTDAYELIPTNNTFITTDQELIPVNIRQKVEYIPVEKQLALQASEFKIELTKDGCNPIIITWQVDTPCELPEPCENTIRTFAKYPSNGQPLYINLAGMSNYSNLYIDWMSCYYLKNIRTRNCGINFYQNLFRNRYDVYIKAENERVNDVMKGISNDTQVTPVPLPSFHEDITYYGSLAQIDNNSIYTEFPIFTGCGCKVQSSVGPLTFPITFLEAVQTSSELASVSGYLGLFVNVISETEFYTWDPITASWVIAGTLTNLNGNSFYTPDNPTVPLDSIDDCYTFYRAKRDLYLKQINEYVQALGPFSHANFMLPYYFAKRQLETPMGKYNYSCGDCPTTEVEIV